MKIYTKAGDRGQTSLATGQKVSKSSLRIAAYGTIDELNSQLGLLRDLLTREAEHLSVLGNFAAKVEEIQAELFELGSELATPPSTLSANRQAAIDDETLARLERDIDEWQEALPPLRNFILAGGHYLNAHAHIARCVARRAEREVVILHELEAQRGMVLQYLNRLSDWLFVLARAISAACASPELIWKKQ